MELAYSRTVVPESHIVLAPLESCVHLRRRADDLSEVFDDGIAFYLWDPDDLGHEARVEEETVPASHWVCSDQRMFCCNRLTTDWSTYGPGVGRLHFSRVEGG